ncbi:hypothetical protein M5K25_001690 [Dendrobium thyrsiflorum]|uniref:Uncharacterized protein n=1 Tax=Dendrobium thyrsiflorum TaxID=117978 RepID=A0ABD0VSK3_DENTH
MRTYTIGKDRMKAIYDDQKAWLDPHKKVVNMTYSGAGDENRGGRRDGEAWLLCSVECREERLEQRMVGEWMMDPIKIPWFRRPGSSWSLVYLVRGGSRPNLTEGSLSAAMGCVVQGYLIDLGGAIWRRTTRFRGPRVITVYPAVPFSGKTAGNCHLNVCDALFENLLTPSVCLYKCCRSGGVALYCRHLPTSYRLFCMGIFYRCPYALTFAIVPLHFLSWVLLEFSAALRRRPRVGAASECVRHSSPPIEAVTVQSRVRVLKFPRSLIRAVTRSGLVGNESKGRFWRKKLEEEDEDEGEEEEEERERKWEGMVGNLKGGRKKKEKWWRRMRGKEEEEEEEKKNGGRGRRNFTLLGGRKEVAGLGAWENRREWRLGRALREKCRSMRVRGGFGRDMRVYGDGRHVVAIIIVVIIASICVHKNRNFRRSTTPTNMGVDLSCFRCSGRIGAIRFANGGRLGDFGKKRTTQTPQEPSMLTSERKRRKKSVKRDQRTTHIIGLRDLLEPRFSDLLITSVLIGMPKHCQPPIRLPQVFIGGIPINLQNVVVVHTHGGHNRNPRTRSA